MLSRVCHWVDGTAGLVGLGACPWSLVMARPNTYVKLAEQADRRSHNMAIVYRISRKYVYYETESRDLLRNYICRRRFDTDETRE